MTITERVRSHICDQLAPEVGRDQLTDDFPLMDNGVLDSITVLQLMTFLALEYGIQVEDADMTYRNLQSLTAIAAMVEAKVARAVPSS